MTYEELLAKINEELATDYEDACGNIPIGLNALRAVVELHKPATVNSAINNGCICMLPNRKCPTIQAIEKEFVK